MNFLRLLFLIFIVPSLSACDTAPTMSSMLGPAYAPISSEVAALAAPGPVSRGAPLYCRAGAGTAKFASGWLDFQITGFVLRPGQRTGVTLAPKKGEGAVDIVAYFDPDGQKMIFCPLSSGPPDKRISCSSLYALESDLQDGIKRTFDVPEAVRGAEITCGYSQASLRKIP